MAIEPQMQRRWEEQLAGYVASSFRVLQLGNVASLPLLILFMTVFQFFSQPIANGVSRYFEYKSDEYGYEISGVTVDEARIAFEKLSAYNLSDPEPSPLIEFWFYDHPALNKRIDNIKKMDDIKRPGA